MKSKCDLPIHTPNYDSSCCLMQLILMFNKTEINHLFNPYGLLLLKTLTKHLNANPSSLLSNDTPLSQLLILAEILSKYSALYYFKGKLEHSKLIIKFGIDSINQSPYKNERQITERKSALANNMACVYKVEGNHEKAALFFEKLLQIHATIDDSSSSYRLDKVISYNNLGIIEMKRSKIAEGLHCFNQAYEEVKEKIEANMHELTRNMVEMVVLLIFNYCFAYKKYLNKSYEDVYDKGLEYAKQYLGNEHPLTVNYKERRLDSIDSIRSSDSSPDVIHRKAQTGDWQDLKQEKNAPCSSSNANKKEDDSKIPEELPSTTISPKQITPQQPQPQADNTESSSIKKKETPALPFKKKRTLRDCFSVAFNSLKPPSQSQQLFATIAKNMKAEREKEQSKATLLSKIEETSESKSPHTKNTIKSLNKYDDMMSSFDLTNQTSTLIPILNKQPSIPALKSRKSINELKVDTTLTVSELKVSSKSIFSTQHTKKGTTEIFKNLVSIKKGDIHHPLVEAATDFEVVDYLNNLYTVKEKNDNSFEKDVAKIIDKSIETPSKAESKLVLSSPDSKMKQLVTMANDDNAKSIMITFTDLQSNIELFKETISYDDIAHRLNQVQFYASMPQHCNLTFLCNVSVLISKVLIKHCQMIPLQDKSKSSTTQELMMLPYQTSISGQHFAFNFLNTDCSCSLSADSKDITFIVYSQKDITLSLRIDIYFDEGSFNTLFIEKEEKGMKTLFYRDNAIYKDLFSKFLVKMQEIIIMNSKHSSPQATFEEIMPFYSKSVFKLDIQDKLNQKDFWIITKDENVFQWRIDLFTLEKIVISNGAFYINKQIVLDSEDFINVIGSDPKDVCNLLSDKDLIIAHKILMNTVKMRNIMLKILTAKNYDSMLRLIKIKPSCFFRFSFVIIHIKKYFCCAFEFIVYSKENYFLRLMLTEAITSRSYSKLYLPYTMNKAIPNLDELKKNLVDEFKLKKELLSDRKRFRNVLVDESWAILTKDSNVVFYENINIILNKFAHTQV